MNKLSSKISVRKAAYLMASVILLLVFAFIDRMEFSDAENYLINYNAVFANELSTDMDISFKYMAILADRLGGITALFLMYSLLSVSLKLMAIYKFSMNIILSLMIYASFYFTLHDIIQIRVAVASSFFLFFLFALLQRSWISSVSYFILAVIFHLQSIFIIAFLIYIKTINNRIRIFFSLILSYIIGALFVLPAMYQLADVFSRYIPAKVIRDITTYYVNNDSVNFTNHHFLVNITITLMYLFFVRFKGLKREELFLLKAISFSLCIFLAFHKINVFAWRLFEYFNIVILIFMPYALVRVKQRHFMILFVYLYIISNFYKSLELWGLI